MILDIERAEQNKYIQLSWDILKFLLQNKSNPEAEKYKILTEELFNCFSQMLNLGSISEPNQFILSLSYESNDNKKEISFFDVAMYWREFLTKKQLLRDVFEPYKKH